MFRTERKALELTEERKNILPTGEPCVAKYHVIQRFFWTHFEAGQFKVSVKIPLPRLYFYDRNSARQYWLSWTRKAKRIVSRKPKVVSLVSEISNLSNNNFEESSEYPEPITR